MLEYKFFHSGQKLLVAFDMSVLNMLIRGVYISKEGERAEEEGKEDVKAIQFLEEKLNT